MQVLSETVSHALLEIDADEFSATSKFCVMMDRFFDSLNVTNYSKCYKKLKIYRMPYRTKDDFQFEVSSHYETSYIHIYTYILL